MTQENRKIVLMVDASRAYERGILQGIARYARLHGAWTFHNQAPLYSKLTDKVLTIRQIKSIGADGIIISEQDRAKSMIRSGLPTIVIRYKGMFQGAINIIDDNPSIGKMAAAHLLSRGYRHFAFCGFDDMQWSREMGKNFSKEIETSGCETIFYEQPKKETLRSWENEMAIIARWLIALPKPVGILICTDERAQHVIEACKIARIKVPEEVAILGVENDELLCSLCGPPLSSIGLNTQKAGFESAALLDRIISGEKLTDQTVVVRPTRIFTRQSTDYFAIDDAEVSKALRYISQNCKRMIQVNEVADKVALSRRSLEKRFRKTINTSIHKQIESCRLEQVIKLLIETNMPVSKIAAALGYTSSHNIFRDFRKAMGINPSEYRKKHSNIYI